MLGPKWNKLLHSICDWSSFDQITGEALFFHHHGFHYYKALNNTLLTQIGSVSVITEIQPLLIEYTELCIVHQVKQIKLFVGEDDDDPHVKRNLRK